MKYIGISVSSQKRKKRKRSSETKTPIMAVSITSMEMKKPFYVFANRLPGAQNRDGREERGQQDEKQADAVHAQVVVNRLADPIVEFLKLVVRVGRIESSKQKQRNREFGEGSGERNPANPHVIVRAEQQQRRNAQERQERDDS